MQLLRNEVFPQVLGAPNLSTGGVGGAHIRRDNRQKTSNIADKICKFSGLLRLAFHRGMWYYKVIFYGGQTPDQNASGRNHNE